MTTFVRSRRNDNVLIGFAALVLAAIAVRLAVADNTVGAVIAGALAAGFVGLAVWLRGRPSLELRVTPAEIVLASRERVVGRIGHAAAGGRVMWHRRIYRGHLYVSLVDAATTPGMSLPLDGFRLEPGALETACAEHGWHFVS